MTDIVALASRLYDRIEWQNVPDDVTQDDLTVLIADAIRFLYVITGRALLFSEDMFVQKTDSTEDNTQDNTQGQTQNPQEEQAAAQTDNQTEEPPPDQSGETEVEEPGDGMNRRFYEWFDEQQQLDEQEYVLVTAEINFYKKVQTSVSDLVSYTTDAMSVSHGDKPFANLQQKITDLSSYQRMIWYKMIRYNML